MRILASLLIVALFVSTAVAGTLTAEEQAAYWELADDWSVFGYCAQYNVTAEGHEYWIDFYYNGVADGWKYNIGGFDVNGIQNYADGTNVRDIWSWENFGRGTNEVMPPSVHVEEDYMQEWAAFRNATPESDTDRLHIVNWNATSSGMGAGLLMTWRLVFDQPYYDGDLWVASWWAAETPSLVFNMPVGGGRLGDFDDDGDIDADDIDALGAAVTAGSTDLDFDMDGDGDVDSDDFNMHVTTLVDTALGEGTGTAFGDFNLDGLVGILDLGLLGDGYNSTNGWANGDANGDGTVGILDLGLLGDNYGYDGSVVPEPATMSLLALGGVALMRRRSR